MKNLWLILLTFSILSFSCNRKEDTSHGKSETNKTTTILADTSNNNITKIEDTLTLEQKYMVFPEASDDIKLPEEIIPFILPRFKVYKFYDGDLNKDRLNDYILILAKPLPKDFNSFKSHLPFGEEGAIVSLLVRQADNTLKLHSKSDKVINHDDLFDYGFFMEIEINTSGDGFTLAYSGQGSSRWDKHFNFKFNKDSNDWILKQISEFPSERIAKSKDFGRISFSQFDFYNNSNYDQK